MNNKFRGLGVAMVTPFTNNGEVDYLALTKLTNHLIDGDVNYLVVMGTTGENPTLDESEQRKILDSVLETNNKRLPVVFGMGGNYTQALCSKIEQYNLEGVDAILSASPYYNKPNQNGIFNHYKAVSESTDLPLIIYNVPGRTGSNIGVETTLKLAEIKNIIATKEASGNFNQCMEIIKNKPADFMVISGDDGYTLPYISCGMEGVISVIGNALPKPFSKMVNLALNGKIEEARVIHYQLLDLMNTIFEDGSPGGIKVILEKLTVCGPSMRAPLYPPSESVKAKLLAKLAKFQN
jgi:4-hydroxy-tetrahydrodipicolinate synthase